MKKEVVLLNVLEDELEEVIVKCKHSATEVCDVQATIIKIMNNAQNVLREGKVIPPSKSLQGIEQRLYQAQVQLEEAYNQYLTLKHLHNMYLDVHKLSSSTPINKLTFSLKEWSNSDERI